ncbi:MAG: malate synthase [Paraglaciecola sp.]|jgi:malate synthase
MQNYIQRGTLQVAAQLDRFIEQEALPASEVNPTFFWQQFEQILADLIPQNIALLKTRDTLQQQIDTYCASADLREGVIEPAAYHAFLQEIGYLEAQPEDFTISTSKVDREVATMAGPQLVVPINNARFALNAINARWGSLYDAVYGSDVLSEADGAEQGAKYNPVRGQKVIKYARSWLDIIAPLASGSHQNSQAYTITSGKLLVTLASGEISALASPGQCIGFQGTQNNPAAILIKHHGLHIELQFDAQHIIGKSDPANLKDLLIESALTTIMDCEDSVAAVDAEDKTLVYQNWLGLINSTLQVEIQKGEQRVVRCMNDDRQYSTFTTEKLMVSGRSMMFVRNVGHLMTNDAILFDGKPIPEGIMDAMLTSLIAKHDLLGKGKHKNSRTGSIYIVKPKMHGSQEVAFADTLFARVEDALGLDRNTIKMGIMDEERRTTVNLKACIYAAKERAVFINTGFLDRTGDEIHTSMQLGAFALKAQIKTRPWLAAYEKANVQAGLKTGMSGKAQIGKGMWPIPDQMANMMANKTGHPLAGANTAWVPSPTAATLHALHYHQIDVFAVQKDVACDNTDYLKQILSVPLMNPAQPPSEQEIQDELDNNVQGILGYVVRWVHQGIGCSKVPDIHNVGLMEDRATLRISSQHLANWLEHGIIQVTQVNASLHRMAELVDKQNIHDQDYIPMQPNPQDSLAFQAAQQLIFSGKEQPSGYTEPLLHAKRKEMKRKLKATA